MTIFTNPGAPGSVGPTSGGKVYAFNNIGTTPGVVAPANASRVQITFSNPGSVILYIAPSFVQALNSIPTSPTNQALTPSVGTYGGCLQLAAGASITITGECQGAYQALAASGTTNPLTVVDTNV